MIDDDDKKIEILGPFLELRLPQLGLDYETYSTYLFPLFNNDDTTIEEEEWDTVLELLRESSELDDTANNDDIWQQLRVDSCTIWKQYCKDESIRIQQLKDEQLQKLSNQLQMECQIAAQNAATAASEPKQQQNEKEKKELIERYGYERDDDDGIVDNKAVGKDTTAAETSGGVISNRDYAAQLEKDKLQQLRTSAKVTTKRDEQAKTKQTKLQKEQTKEERRKRAVKGERKR